MKGCLGRLGCLASVAVLLVGAWWLREPIVGVARRVIGKEAPLPSTASVSIGAPTEAAVASAQAKTEALESANGPDSVVLTANEAASLLGLGLDWSVRQAFDSLRIELLEGRVALHARLEMARLPADALGPLAGTLDVSEPVRLEGTIAIEEPGRGRLFVEGFRVRAFEFPRSAVRRLVQRVAPTDPDGSLLVGVPPGIGGLRIAPDGITLYRVRRGG